MLIPVIADNAVTSQKVGDQQIGINDLADNAVHSLKIQDHSVSREEIDQQIIEIATYFAGASVYVLPNEYRILNPECAPGYTLTGGGYRIEPTVAPKLDIQADKPDDVFPSKRWEVILTNREARTFLLIAYVVCIDVRP